MPTDYPEAGQVPFPEMKDIDTEKRQKMLEWRKNVINEVIQTERGFVEDMDLLIEVQWNILFLATFLEPFYQEPLFLVLILGT